MKTSLHILLMVAFVVISSHAGAAVMTETFDTDTVGRTATLAQYPNFIFTGSGGETDVNVVNGELQLISSGNGVANRNHFVVHVPTFSGVTLKGNVTKTPAGSSFNAGMTLGGSDIVFHPGYGGGAFRIEGRNAIGNQNMGFTVGGHPVQHQFELNIDNTGLVNISVTDGANPGNVYNYSYTDATLLSGGRLGFNVAGGNGNTGVYDNLEFDAPAPPAATNVAFGKSYKYELTIPGQPPYYLDDPHAVHSSGLDVYDTGDLTDGVLGNGTDDASTPSPIVALRGNGGGNLPMDVTFDLEDLYAIDNIIVGTSIRGVNGQFGNYAPDDVDVSFSEDGISFGPETNYGLWATTETLANGHFEMTLDTAGMLAQYVKLSFDGQLTEKFVLDEITINGLQSSAAVPEPSTFALAAHGRVGLGWFARRRKRKNSADILITAKRQDYFLEASLNENFIHDTTGPISICLHKYHAHGSRHYCR